MNPETSIASSLPCKSLGSLLRERGKVIAGSLSHLGETALAKAVGQLAGRVQEPSSSHSYVPGTARYTGLKVTLPRSPTWESSLTMHTPTSSSIFGHCNGPPPLIPFLACPLGSAHVELLMSAPQPLLTPLLFAPGGHIHSQWSLQATHWQLTELHLRLRPLH